jgi:hypothetical protein
MATHCAGAALGVADYIDHREVNQLKLGAEHVPFPCSLRELVLDRYGDPPGSGSNAHAMQVDELIGYLRNVDNFSLSPWVAVVGQTEAIGDPATPSREHVAILRWLGKALELWEKQFPLEGRLAAQVRRMKPLSAAVALVDPRFMQPGAHPIHQLLDSIQARAIGWQARLDRVGAVLEQQVTKAVDDSRKWFDSRSIDLDGVSNEFTAAAERDRARTQRMVQRVVEAEAGKAKTAAAKHEAARMINEALEKYPATEEIGRFLRGPWYTSAQLLLLKFGSDAEQWRLMSATTETLLDSLQSVEDDSEARRQHIFEVVTQLPKDMRRWLLSLHHDTEAVNEAMGLVEFAHLKILRRQPLDLQRISPIVVEGGIAPSNERQNAGASKSWQEGQWFIVDTAGDGIVRMQLVLKVDQSQQLLFTNLAGIKVLELSFTEFDNLFDQGKVKALQSGASFSLCLAYAVGIESVEILNALANALAESESISDRESESAASENPSPKSARKPQPKAVKTPTPEPESEKTVDMHAILEHKPELVRPEELPTTVVRPLVAPPQSAPTADAESSDDRQKRGKQRPLRKDVASLGSLFEQAQEIKARGGYRGPPTQELGEVAHDDTQSDESFSPAVESHEEDSEGDNSGPKVPGEPGLGRERQINLPMGAWLGFHDGETPLMARLAVHDTEGDYYIFVNRKGVKMRQVSRLELLDLIDHGMIDILEANSNFRDTVTEVRKNLDQ